MPNLLSSNPDHIQCLCSRLDLGTPRQELSRVTGGFHHKMWRLETDRGIYAVKQLSDDTDLNDVNVINHYNLTEQVAEIFANRNIVSIHALSVEENYLQIIEHTGYLVYPWSDAVGLDKNQISAQHALKIAAVLAKMHQADVDVPGLKEAAFDIHSNEKIIEIVRRAEACHVRYAKTLDKELPIFLEIVDTYKTASDVLENHLVISHGDLDQKNVLWDMMENPVIIDWESARKLNPTYEVVLTALEWSGITTTQFDHVLFGKMIAAYQQAGGVIEQEFLEASFHCILGDWLYWLIYVVARSMDQESPIKCAAGTEEFDLVLPTILRLKQLIPALLSMNLLYKEAEVGC